MAEQLPIITKSHALDSTEKTAGSLLGRGLDAIQSKKTDITTPEIDNNSLANNTVSIQSDSILCFSAKHYLQWDETQLQYLIIYPDGTVELNQSSAEILKRCDGFRNVSQIITELESIFAVKGIGNDIIYFLTTALQNGWIEHTQNHNES
jgi:pyrroloquinoline quinone biosynthesis protein D